MSEKGSYIDETNILFQPKSIQIEESRTIISQLENCICLIYPKKGGTGTGFFCRIPFHNVSLNMLITNNHVLDEEEIKNNNSISLDIYDKKEKKEKNVQIEIDDTRKKYTNPDKDVDVTFIEIKKKDDINEFLDIDEEFLQLDEKMIEEKFKNYKSIYVLHYPEKKLISYGVTGGIENNKKIKHYSDTKSGSSGSPILSLDNLKVIGVHHGYHEGNHIFNIGTYIKYVINEFENKYGIDIFYQTDYDGIQNIFGEKFVENNKDKIDLIINGTKTNLISRYNLKKGENKIQIKLKENLYHLEYMFYRCYSLTHIDGLKYLNTNCVSNFSYMFDECFYLFNLNPLKDWDVSFGENFSCMFGLCTSLLNLDSLKDWNVSNGENFYRMFWRCSKLSDINGLQNWNMENAIDLQGMFTTCQSLTNLYALRNWKVSKVSNFSYMFFDCISLTHLFALENWDVSSGDCFEEMFYGCTSLIYLNGLENWKLSNANCLKGMFSGCSSLIDISSLVNWNVSKVKYFNGMFDKCKELRSLGALRNWNVLNGINFSYMFYDCEFISPDSLIEWKVCSESYFENMFGGCFNDLKILKKWGLSEEKMKTMNTMKTIKDNICTYSSSNMNSLENMDNSDKEKPVIKKKRKKLKF